MVDFDSALAVTLAFEGLYSNDPNDPGGETFRGISRARHSRWCGWQAIDRAKCVPSFPDNLSEDSALEQRVAEFYRVRFWDTLHCAAIGQQALASLLFDSGVNLGVATATRLLQRALNFLKQPGDLLTVDGKLGPRTLERCRKVMSDSHGARLYEILYILRGQRYLLLAQRRPALKKYLGGWLWRLNRLRYKQSDSELSLFAL